jgi:hypothetical protein
VSAEEHAMPQYLLSIYQPDTAPPPPETLGPIMAKVAAWEQELKSAGAWVFTAGLQPPDTATVIRSEDGQVVTLDGPYVEGKEHLGGFTVISVPDRDAAVAWGQKLAGIITLPVEVRPTASGSD